MGKMQGFILIDGRLCYEAWLYVDSGRLSLRSVLHACSHVVSWRPSGRHTLLPHHVRVKIIHDLVARTVGLFVNSRLHCQILRHARRHHGHSIDILPPFPILFHDPLIGFHDFFNIANVFFVLLALVTLSLLELIVHLLDDLVDMSEILA